MKDEQFLKGPIIIKVDNDGIKWTSDNDNKVFHGAKMRYNATYDIINNLLLYDADDNLIAATFPWKGFLLRWRNRRIKRILEQ